MYPKFESSSDLILYLIRVSFFMGLIFGGFMVSEIVNLFQSINDLGKFIDALFSTFTNLVALVKLISIAWNQDKLVILSEKIDRMEFRPKSENQEKILRSHVKISKFLSLSMYCGCVSTCLFWIMFSLTDEDGRLLLVPAYFPFMNESTGVFIFCYIFEIVALWVSGFSDLSADCFIASWIMVVSAQLKLLNDTLANLHDFAEDELKKYQNPLKLDKKSTVFRKIMNKKLIECIIHYQYILEGHRDRGSLVVSEGSSEDENSLVNNEGCIMVVSAELRLLNDTLANLHNFAEDEFKKYQKSLELDKRSTEFKKMMNKKLIECIIHYQYILEFAEEVNDLFSISIFGQLNVSLFAICATLFEITSSDKLTTSAYQSDWLDCSAEYKQNLLFFMTRTQKVLILYAGNFVEISLNIFVTILKSSYSFCTVLNQFGE
ncbi:unnamed protein product [Psylliodes chrysocephalus]|uniref:Odorant receptor n=1 Tax=Psylliodes chrysocephalus TaxID=3402493 RepID=A0A9P0CF46_9CUCU|nr:unnamed protein product [Psylliodes chrysocephala]